MLELCRFASPETEERLVVWAQRTSLGVVRAKADAAVRRNRDELLEIERSRSLRTWYFDEGTRFGMEAELPAADGAIVERALERLAARIPVMSDEETASTPMPAARTRSSRWPRRASPPTPIPTARRS